MAEGEVCERGEREPGPAPVQRGPRHQETGQGHGVRAGQGEQRPGVTVVSVIIDSNPCLAADFPPAGEDWGVFPQPGSAGHQVLRRSPRGSGQEESGTDCREVF